MTTEKGKEFINRYKKTIELILWVFVFD
jgi:predicted transcriptional regulator